MNEILRCLFALPQKTKQKQTHIYSSSGLEPFNLIKKIVSCLYEIYLIIDVVFDKMLISYQHLLLEWPHDRLLPFHFLWGKASMEHSTFGMDLLNCITFGVAGTLITDVFEKCLFCVVQMPYTNITYSSLFIHKKCLVWPAKPAM